jgi:hypothetical protein
VAFSNIQRIGEKPHDFTKLAEIIQHFDICGVIWVESESAPRDSSSPTPALAGRADVRPTVHRLRVRVRTGASVSDGIASALRMRTAEVAARAPVHVTDGVLCGAEPRCVAVGSTMIQILWMTERRV